jgi:uncharacterized protein YndB with AHSA1/START domain
LAADSVEREILIEATPEVVWGVITEPEQISRWFSDAADVEGRAGADGTLTWRPGPFRRFSFRWNHPHGEGPDASNSALVEFSLAEEDGATRLTVLESGIGAVTHDEQSRARYLEEHERGWVKHLGELRDYVASEPPEVTG